jgi:hypothetical protein
MTGQTFASLLLEQYGYHPWLECKANTKLYNALRREIRPVGDRTYCYRRLRI